ncbi:UNVERIFIED_CONTAM: Mitogen-activated protein kinase [Sesamum radiatum]|uniref:Mitogen-activated protein kinase n=1 Tax=Sesamum radiatum TaxID=300843 RepID=A0AAW2S8I2_SESRA
MQPDQRKKASAEIDFFTEYGEGSRYRIEEVIGKGSYGVVCSAYDTHLGEKVAIKKINDIFEHVSDATRILREIKLLRLLRHPDIVEIKHILLPPSRREFKDIYVVFELMESDLHQVIKANDDLTPEHYQFFLYQLLRGMKYIHTANVFHRDLKPKNILANADCKLKICDFGLARVAFNDTPTAIFWTYTPAIDIWSIGCIFAELLTGKPLFPGKNVVHQLDLMTDLLGTPPPETIARALADPYFRNLARVEREPSAQPVTKMEFEFERRRITKEDVRELIYREILEYHPKMLKEFLEGAEPTGFMYPRPCVLYSESSNPSMIDVANDLSKCSIEEVEKQQVGRASVQPMTRFPVQVPQNVQGGAARPGKVIGSVLRYNNCGAAAASIEATDQRNMARNLGIPAQYIVPSSSYPRKHPSSKNVKGEEH